MNSTLIFLILGAAIGILIGYSKMKNSNSSYKREPQRPFPYQWRDLLTEHVDFYNRLNSIKKTEFEKRVHVFLLNVQITGIETDVSHLDKILVASGAIIPIFGFESWHYANLDEVQLFPDKFIIPNTNKYASGLVGWGRMEGKMMLSKKALHEGFYDAHDQKNVAIHEFIHILDKQDGKVDGLINQVMNEIDIQPWLHIIHQKMNEISQGHSSIRPYASANNAEFLAVVSEFFFESPEKMKSEHPDLYSALDSFYNPKILSKKLFKFNNKDVGNYNKNER